jgi:hypothetical protein
MEPFPAFVDVGWVGGRLTVIAIFIAARILREETIWT